MFTGIIQHIGRIKAIEDRDNDARFVFDTADMDLSDIAVGESIAVNGACLTVIDKENNSFSADLSAETLSLTTFSGLSIDSRVNLEKAMRLSDRLNGHLVSGHVDGIGTVTEREEEGRSVRFQIEVPKALIKYISHKGSVTVDGVSLTVNEVVSNTFSVNIIPHTLSETIIEDYTTGINVNIEVDMLARYIDQLMHKE